MSKVELQAKVDALEREIKFFTCLYEGVSLPSSCPYPGSIVWKDRCVNEQLLTHQELKEPRDSSVLGCWEHCREKQE